jgi:SAM-dependent methyltransferase
MFTLLKSKTLSLGSSISIYYNIVTGKFKIMTFKNKNSTSNIRDFFKRWPVFYYFVEIVFGPTLLLGLNAKDFLKKYKLKEGVVNVGSGPRRLDSSVQNIDKFDYKGVDIVADIEKRVPLENSSVSGIVCDNVLEHLSNPESAIREFHRILRPDGLVYISTPFYYPFHPSPSDFTRWTKEGLLNLFEEFEIVEIGVRSGPFSALSVTLSYLFATVFSFGSNFLYWLLLDLSMLIFFPIKFLDFIFNYWPNAVNMAAVLYLVVKKK